MNFNIFSKIEAEIQDFDTKGYYITGKPNNESEYARNKGSRGGYYYNQRDILESIDLASASKYKKGIWDDQGERKTFINIVNFYRDVMKMKIKIGVSDYIMTPTSPDFEWPVWLMDREFKHWAQVENYDDQIAEYAHDLATYGSTVGKKLKDCTDRVPIRTMRNTPSAKTLYSGAMADGYVLLENDMHYNEMEEYPGWNLKDLDSRKKYIIMERYGLAPAGLVKNYASMTSEEVANYVAKPDEKMILSSAIVVRDGAGAGHKGQQVIYMQKLSEKTWPFEECHTEQRDGRWLGIGEIEKQLENQISRNLTANLRRRGLLWATKKLFYSTDENVQKNLVMEVADGDTLFVKNGGQIAQINTTTQSLAEFQSDENMWKENSQQIAFAFEAATGETMPAGTPFSLGVILQKAVASHFDLTRTTYSNFLKRSFFDQLVPIFQQEYKDPNTVLISLGESDIQNLMQAMIIYHTNVRIWDMMLAKRNPDAALVQQQVEQEIRTNSYLYLNNPDSFYENIEWYLKLNLIEDIGPDIASLTTIWQAYTQKGDPRADTILAKIMALRGKSLADTIGPPPANPNPGPAPAQPVVPAQLPAPVVQ